MKTIFLLAAAFILLSFTGSRLKKKIEGNWITDTDLYGIEAGDTIAFTKKKYSYELYTWGGPISGIEFQEDSSFTEHENVLCSTESSNVRFYDEKYYFESDSIINVESNDRTLRFRIASISAKKLSIIILQASAN